MKKSAFIAGLLVSAFIVTLAAQSSVLAMELTKSFSLGDISVTSEYKENQPEEVEEGEVLAAATEVASESESETADEPEQVVVTVASGDSLSKIATTHNTTYKRLFDANPSIVDPNVINPGDQIRIPAENEELASRELPVSKPAAKKPAAEAPTSPKPAVAAARIANDGSVWSQLAMCESGGRPNVVSANGKYHGLYQFLPSTWRAVGGSGLPSQASAEEQTMRAQMLQARSGWGQWPACARKIGVL